MVQLCDLWEVHWPTALYTYNYSSHESYLHIVKTSWCCSCKNARNRGAPIIRANIRIGWYSSCAYGQITQQSLMAEADVYLLCHIIFVLASVGYLQLDWDNSS